MTMKAVCFRAKYFSFLLAISLFLSQSLFAAGSGTIKLFFNTLRESKKLSYYNRVS